MNYRAKNIGIAVALAALAAILTSVYVVNYKRHVQHGEGKVTVLVAARDIPAGTSGPEIIDQHMLKQETVPRKAVVAWIVFVLAAVALGAVTGTKTLDNGAVGESARGYAIMNEHGLWGPAREVAYVASALRLDPKSDREPFLRSGLERDCRDAR